MKIYTSILTKMHGETEIKMLNILHMHFEDFCQEVAFSAVYMEDGQKLEDHMEFTKDASGKMLDYKILVKDCMIVNVLHKNDEKLCSQNM